jgi:hypothetical protein
MFQTFSEPKVKQDFRVKASPDQISIQVPGKGLLYKMLVGKRDEF